MFFSVYPNAASRFSDDVADLIAEKKKFVTDKVSDFSILDVFVEAGILSKDEVDYSVEHKRRVSECIYRAIEAKAQVEMILRDRSLSDEDRIERATRKEAVARKYFEEAIEILKTVLFTEDGDGDGD